MIVNLHENGRRRFRIRNYREMQVRFDASAKRISGTKKFLDPLTPHQNPRISQKMYTLNVVDSFHISEPADTYIYDIVPVAAGLAAISSDDSLRLFDPLALSRAPLNSIRRVNTDVTCLKAVNSTTEGDALIVCTAGRDGRVCLLDPRTGSKIGEVRTGELVFSHLSFPAYAQTDRRLDSILFLPIILPFEFCIFELRCSTEQK
jgi:hypothetical protein